MGGANIVTSYNTAGRGSTTAFHRTYTPGLLFGKISLPVIGNSSLFAEEAGLFPF
jgi:hypothetical protein